jgi:diguanylate cyclase (GGDEF)-like protein/PAS domain S-box-containing protein
VQQQLTVLVVDDDKITTAILKNMLNKYADHVILASNGEEGLDRFKEYQPEIVLSDINMPKMGGLEMVEKIRALDDNVKIAIFTNFENRDILLKAIQIGVNQFFSKPFEAKVFAQVIQPLCDDALQKKHIQAELNRHQNILHAINEMAHSFLQQSDWKASLYEELLLLKQASETSAVFLYENNADTTVATQIMAITDTSPRRKKRSLHYKKHHLMRWKRRLQKGNYVNGCFRDYDRSKQRILHAYQIDSLLILPIFVSGKWWGFLGIGNSNRQEMNETDVEMLSTVASIIGSAINNRQNMQSLEMSSTVFEHTMDGVLITNADNRIVHVNDSFENITGYAEDDVLGKDPKLLKSGVHDKHFYKRMWNQLTQNDSWQGEITNRKKNGEIYIEWLSVNVIRNNKGEVENFIGIFSDVTHQRKDAQEQAYLATHDPLTGLSNRLLLNDRLDHAINHAYRFNKCIAVIFCDLDNFKPINDLYGHSAGDNILKGVAKEMKQLLRKEDTICRFGGDEFVILIEELKSFEYLEKILDKIRTISDIYFHIEGHDLQVGMSIGAALYPNDASSSEALLKCADEAMYKAKKCGKNRIAYYQNDPLIYCANTYII